MSTGEYLWSKTFGEYEELTAEGKAPTGAENFGGPITTASGVLFIGATLDGFIRAYDMTNGNELWKDKLPAGGYATPVTYSVDGKQFVVIACGGGRGSRVADLYVAYSLP
jgi:quinoprotein glucose dehydrogenase